MRTGALAVAAMCLIAGTCAAVGPADGRLPDSALRTVNGGVVLDDWPAAARRAWPGGGHNGMPAGFVDEVLIDGLDRPTALRFLPGGQLVVTEQSGLVKIYPAADVDEPRVLLDLHDETLLNYQLGLLGLAVDPDFDGEPYIYLVYTHDAPIGGVAPAYGSPDGNDACPSRYACPASGRLVRYRLEGDPPSAAGAPQVLIEDWCISGVNHSVGGVAFAPDGALFVGGGDGADGDAIDTGQLSPDNPCGDAAGETGSMRSQDVAFATDPVGLAGTIARVDRATGQALPDNPLGAALDENARRIVANGLRNPFRFAFRPGTDELWIADVGWHKYEELDRLTLDGNTPANFGWPCYEGADPQPEWQSAAPEACGALAADDSAVTFPRVSLARGSGSDEPCDIASAAISALVFYDGAAFPEAFDGALFFADMAQHCLFVIEAGPDGQPDPHTIRLFAHPVRISDMVVGTDGAMYYTHLVRGEIRRIRWQ